MSINNLVIGTANFGAKYGYKKKITVKKFKEIFDILNKIKLIYLILHIYITIAKKF